MNSRVVAHEIVDGSLLGGLGRLEELDFLDGVFFEFGINSGLFLYLLKVGQLEVLLFLVPLVCLGGNLGGLVKGLHEFDELLVADGFLGGSEIHGAGRGGVFFGLGIGGGDPRSELAHVLDDRSCLPDIVVPACLCVVSIDTIFTQEVVVSAYACVADVFSKREEEKEIQKRRGQHGSIKAALLKQNMI